MSLFHLLTLAFLRKVFAGVMTVSLLTFSAYNVTPDKRNKQTAPGNIEQDLLYPSNPYNFSKPAPVTMHDGVNNFIEITGWDRSVYRASIELAYQKTATGNYALRPPRFVIDQGFNQQPFTMPYLNVLTADNRKVNYKCIAVPDSKNPGTINMAFTHCNSIADSGSVASGTNFMQFDDPLSNRWNAYIDSTYTRINDTIILLKFRLERVVITASNKPAVGM